MKILKILLFLFLSYISHAQSSCDLDYYVNNNINDTCFVAGNDISFTYTSNVIINIQDLNGTTVASSGWPPTNLYTWPNCPSGTYIINIIGSSFQTLCYDTITIAAGIVNIGNPIILDYCQWNTINLEDELNSFLQNGTNPQYEFSIGGSTINGSDYQIVDTDSIFIDVLITDASGCILNTELIINPTANNTNTQSYTISDTIVQFCEQTIVDFFINSPDTNYTYNWYIDNNYFQNTDNVQYIFDPISNYQGPVSFDIEIEIIEDSTGCNVSFPDQVSSLGLTFPTGSVFSIPDYASPGCTYDSLINAPASPSIYWPEIDQIPITQMGPSDTIFWFIYCQNIPFSGDPADIDTFIWNYSDLPSLIQPNPQDSSSNVAALEIIWLDNSCNCVDEKYKIHTVISGGCGNNEKIATKSVNDPILAAIEITTPICQNDTAIFQNNSEIGCAGNTFQDNDTIVYYNWDFGDCTPLTTISITDPSNSFNPFPNIAYSYPLPGIYTVTLEAYAYCLPPSDTSAIITVYPKPNVSFTHNESICDGDSVFFSTDGLVFADSAYTRIDTCSVFPDTIHINVPAGNSNFTYLWDFDDPSSGVTNNTSDDPNPSHQFSSCGSYNVSLTITDGNNCSKVFEKTVIIYDLPNPNTSTNVVCSPDTTSFYDNSYYSTIPPDNCFGNPIEQWTWNFGDGTILTTDSLNSDTVKHKYNPDCNNIDFVNYSAQLTVTDIMGCSDSIPINVRVDCEQNALFSDINGQCQYINDNTYTTTIWNQSTLNPPSPADPNYIVWTIEDISGNIIYTDYQDGYSNINLTYSFSQIGTFIVTMDINGTYCSGSHSDTIEIWPNPSASGLTTHINCWGDNTGSIEITANGGTPYNSPPSYLYSWSGPNGFFSNSEDLNNLFSGTYNLQVFDSLGCTSNNFFLVDQTDSLSKNVITQNVNCFGGDDGSATVNIISGGNPPYSYQWSDGQTTDTAVNLSAGLYYCIITDDSLCIDTANFSIDHPDQLVFDTTTQDVNCFGGNDGSATVNIISGGNPPYSYQWDDPAAQTTATADSLSAGTYTCIITYNNDCDTSVTVTINHPDQLVYIVLYC